MDGETGQKFAAQLCRYFDHSIEMAGVPKKLEGLRDRVVSEQFLRCCHSKLVVFLKERDCNTLNTPGDHAERFVEAINLSNLRKGAEDEGKQPRRKRRKTNSPSAFVRPGGAPRSGLSPHNKRSFQVQRL